MSLKNPCESCGACCAYFRVSFYWGELDSADGGIVPEEMSEDISPFFQAMKGTNQKQPRCVALQGEPGRQVHCNIYEKRSSSCRDFGIHWKFGLLQISGEDLARCNAARAAWGLPALKLPRPSFEVSQPEKNSGAYVHMHILPARKTRKGSHHNTGNLLY
jgi:Fe-S-cluster containining protein